MLQNCILPWKTEVRNCTSAYDAPCHILIKTKKNLLLIFIFSDNWYFFLGLVHSITPETTLSIPSSRFCFETTPYLTPCTCETSITSCTENPCLTDVCPSYPEAICHVDFCSECKATWYYNNQEVDCLEDRGKGALCVEFYRL